MGAASSITSTPSISTTEINSSPFKGIRPKVIIVLGGPQSGKSTQSKYIEKQYGFVYLSVPILLKEETAKDSEVGNIIKQRRAEKKIIESDILITLIENKMGSCIQSGKTQFLIQGFPQNLENYEGYRRKIQHFVTVLGVLYISCDQETLNKRISAKADAEKKQYLASYNVFVSKTLSIIQKFDSEGQLYKIDGNKSAEEVKRQVDSIFTVTINQFHGVIPRVLFVLGCTGSGKSKQCDYISSVYGYAIINPKSIIEEESRLSTPEGTKCKAALANIHKIEPTLLLNLLRKRMALHIKLGQTRFMLDDFPTTINVLNEWRKTMSFSTEIIGRIFFDCQMTTIVERLTKLKVTQEAIDSRMALFEETKLVIDQFEKEKLLLTIDANKDSKEISDQIDELFTTKFYDFPGGMPNILFIMGGPGSGKTSVCQFIEKTYGFEHICVGDLLKKETEQSSNEGKTIKQHLVDGTVVPVAITLSLIRKKIIQIARDGNLHILIDGFPRNSDNYIGWNKEMSGSVIVIGSIILECNEKMSLMRLVESDKKAGKTDTTATIKKRFVTYNRETIPLIKLFEEKGICYKVNSEQTEKQVQNEINTIMMSHLNQFCGRPEVLFVVGGPGTGKSCQCDYIEKTFGYVHISTGKCLREEAKKTTPDAKLIEDCMKQGKSVPISIVIRIIRQKLQELSKEKKTKIILDGFPRNLENIDEWRSDIGNNITIKGILHFDCKESSMIARCLARGKTSGRVDDNEVAIKKQLTIFKAETIPVVAMFEAQHKVFKINSDGAVADVSKLVNDVFTDDLFEFIGGKPIVMFVLGGPGAGKGIQCEYMSKKYGAVHLSSGDCLRDEIESKSRDAEIIQFNMNQGLLVPLEIVIRVLRKQMIKFVKKGSKKFVIDGFPATIDSVDHWTRNMGSSVILSGVLFFSCNDQLLEKRSLERGKSTGRSDDNVTSVKKRIAIFHQETIPVISRFKSLKQLFEINTERPIADIQKDIDMIFSAQMSGFVGPKPAKRNSFG